MDTFSSSASSSEFSRNVAAVLLSETRGRTTSAVLSDWVVDLWEGFTGTRPSRESVMPWVHLAMVAAALYGISKLKR